MDANPEAGIPTDLLEVPLTKYLTDYWRNVVAATHNIRPMFDDFAEIDNLYRLILDNLNQVDDQVPNMLLFRSHTAYLGAVTFAISGQAGESYVAMRAALEGALYSHFIAGNLARQRVWLDRHQSNEARKKSRKEFHTQAMIKHLSDKDSHLGGVFQKLYDRTIDLGAHPNPYATLSQFDISSTGTRHEFIANYFVFDEPYFPMCLKSVAQVGINALNIFEHLYKTRFKILQIDSRLSALDARY